MSSIFRYVQRRHRVRLAGENGRFAYVAHKAYAPVFLLDLEYHFLRRIVHAGLTDVVRWLGIVIRRAVQQDVRTGMDFTKCILLPVLPAALKLSNACCELSFVVFERLNLILHRRHFLLRLQCGVLDVEDPFLQRLERIGELRVVSCCDGCLCEIKKCFCAAQYGADRTDVHGGSPL